jgi:hypothetical protein
MMCGLAFEIWSGGTMHTVGYLDLGSLPEPVRPDMDRFEMALYLVGHARRHFEDFSAHTRDLQFSTVDNPAGGKVMIVSPREATPVAPGDELALEAEVKHCVEDLRSALEYVAMEIYERACCSQSHESEAHDHESVTFPVPHPGEGETRTADRIQSIFPGLARTFPDTFQLLFECRELVSSPTVWLDTVHSAWTRNKHHRLSRVTIKDLTVNIGTTNGLVTLPPLPVHYFPGTTCAVKPNLSAALVGVDKIVRLARERVLREATVAQRKRPTEISPTISTG